MASILLRPKCVKSCVFWPRIFSEIVLFAQKIYQQLCTLALDMITSGGSTPVRGISYRSQPPTSSHRKPLGPHSHYLQRQEIIMYPGARFNIKMLSYQYRKSHSGDKTVVRSSYLHNGISYTGKMSSLYWIGAQIPVKLIRCKHCIKYNDHSILSHTVKYDKHICYCGSCCMPPTGVTVELIFLSQCPF